MIDSKPIFAIFLTLPFLTACVSTPTKDTKGFTVANNCLQYTRTLVKSPGLYVTKNVSGRTTGVGMAFVASTVREFVSPVDCDSNTIATAAQEKSEEIFEVSETSLYTQSSSDTVFENIAAVSSSQINKTDAMDKINAILKEIVVEKEDEWHFSFSD